MTMDRTPSANGALVGLIDELAGAHTPDYLEAAIDRASARAQRPAWTFPARWLPIAERADRPAFAPRLPWRTLAVGLIVVALIIAATVIVVGSRQARPAQPFGLARNGLMAYAKDGDIYTGDPITGATRPLLVGPGIDSLPRYSRDGSLIAFQRLVDGSSDSGNAYTYRLMVMRADGSDVRVVTAHPFIDPQSWGWTPDGRSLFVVGPGLSELGHRTLTVYDIDGSVAPRVLVDLTRDGIFVTQVAFRPPDGNEILVRGSMADQVGLWVMAPDGTHLRSLVPAVSTLHSPRTLRAVQYSPDGSHIAFSDLDDQTDTFRSYVMRADGTDRIELGADPDIWATDLPVWSNDGTKLAVQRGGQVTESSPNGVTYAIIDVATGTVSQSGSGPAWGSAVWAPDDSSLLLQHGDGVTTDLLLDPAGGPTRALPWTTDDLPDWQRLAP